ncbi:MAG: glycosyltransferase [Kiritimatiellales bacterium]|nr:glycosyltransferase [Kiritimatiellales bacterium]
MNVVALSGIGRSAGGLFYAVSSLYKALETGGARVSVLGADHRFSEEDRAVWSPVSVTSYKAFGPLQSSVELRRLLALADGDLVHQHGIWLDDQWAARQWQKKTKRPVVISPHGMLDPWALRNSAWKKNLVGRLFANESLNQATCIHALCQSEVDSIRAYGLKNPVALIPNGVDLPELAEAHPMGQGEKKKLLFLGRIHPKKGLKELLQAWGMAHGTWRKDWELVIAGWDDGGHESGLKALSAELGVADSVSFVGAQFGNAKETLLRSVDAFILPSFSEGLPMSVLEAWSYRLPVLMTGFCNLPEGFKADAAIHIEPTVESIATGLAELAGLPLERLGSMGVNGRRLVEETFTWTTIARNMARVYEWCLAGASRLERPDFIEIG